MVVEKSTSRMRTRADRECRERKQGIMAKLLKLKIRNSEADELESGVGYRLGIESMTKENSGDWGRSSALFL
jgi:hypothetical protein